MAAKHSRTNKGKNTKRRTAEDYLLDDYIEAYRSRMADREQDNSTENKSESNKNTDNSALDKKAGEKKVITDKAETKPDNKIGNKSEAKADTDNTRVEKPAEEKTDKSDENKQKEEKPYNNQNKGKKNKKSDRVKKTAEPKQENKPEQINKAEATADPKQENKSSAKGESERAEVDVNEQPKNEQSLRPTSKSLKVLAGVLIGAVVLGGAYTAVGCTYYGDRFRAGTTLNGIDCSNMSADEIVNDIKSNYVDNYQLDIYNNDTLVDTINGSDIELKIGDNINEYVTDIIHSQNKLYWAKKYLLGRESEIVTDIPVEYNEDKLNALINASAVNSLKKTIDNVPPSVHYDGERFAIEQAVQGDEIDTVAFADRVKEYVAKCSKRMVLQSAEVYVKPESVDIPDLQRQCDAANKYAGVKLSVQLEGTDIDIGNDIVTQSVIVDENSNVTCDDSTIKAAVDSITAKYSTAGMERQFLTSHGGYATVKGGDYGCAVVMTGVLDKAKAAILNGEEVSMTVPYAQDVYNGIGNGADIGNTYVEVDLTNQYCYVYIDGVLKYQTPVVTGLTGARATPQGVYMLKNKMMDVPLVGDNYVTPVKYWMPFNGGIGLHDAVWQSAFGGDRYKTKGSHGCVNLSMTSATNIYSLVEKGMPVVCYYYDRISSFTQIKSPDKVMSTYRALNAKEQAMLKQIKSGKKVTGAVYASNVGTNAKVYGNTNASAQTALANRATESIVAGDTVATPAGGSAD